MLVAAEALKRPELAGYKPAKLDESAIVETILEGVFAADKNFQTYLATGQIVLDAPVAVAAKKK